MITNKLPLFLGTVLLALIVALSSSNAASANSTNLQLEIQGIECDLEAVYEEYGYIPDYCSNKPENPNPEPEPEEETPVTTDPSTISPGSTGDTQTRIEYSGLAPSAFYLHPIGSREIDSPIATYTLYSTVHTDTTVDSSNKARNASVNTATTITVTAAIAAGAVAIDAAYFGGAARIAARRLLGAIKKS